MKLVFPLFSKLLTKNSITRDFGVFEMIPLVAITMQAQKALQLPLFSTFFFLHSKSG